MGVAALGLSCAVAPANAEPYKPYQFGLWSFVPSVELNAILKDNLYGSRLKQAAGAGVGIAPSFTLTRDAGLHVTTISASETAAFFPGHADVNTHAERLGLTHVFRPWREQSFTLSANYNQSAGGIQAPGGGLIATTATGDSQTAQVGFATERAFGRLVTTFNANASFSDVNNANRAPIIVASLPPTDPNAPASGAPGLFTALPSGRSSTYSATLGASYIGPFLSPFASVSATSQQSERSGDTRSLQMQTGVSTGRWRLYRGEVHVGYLVSATDQAPLLGAPPQGDTHSPSVGGSVTWDPLRYLSLTFGANAQFGAIALPSVANVISPATTGAATGSPSSPSTTPPGAVVPAGRGGSTVGVTGSASYSFSRRWSATAGFGYTVLNGGAQKSKVETASVAASYNWSQVTDLTFSYIFTRTDSQLALVLGQPGASGPLVSNVVRAGVRRRF